MSLNIAEVSPGVNRQGRVFSRLENSQPAESTKSGGGFVRAPNAITAMQSLPDSAFRLWIAIQEFSWRGAVPTNEQLARACGWVGASDDRSSAKPSTSKVKRWLRVLIQLGLAERTVETLNNRTVRTALGPMRTMAGKAAHHDGPNLARPTLAPAKTRDARLTPQVTNSDPQIGLNSDRNDGSILAQALDRCRKKLEDSPRSGRGEESISRTKTTMSDATIQARFLSELPTELRAVFDAESPRSQASILKRFDLGSKADYEPVIADTLAMLKNRLGFVASRPIPTSAAQDPKSLMQAVANGDHAATLHLAQRLAVDFGGDRKSIRAFEKLGNSLLIGMHTVDEVWLAYTKATSPAAKNPGAIFNVELRGTGSRAGMRRD